ncbi:MAG: hypothetical protein ACTII7_08055 [Galactobacter sp.]
MSRTKKSAGSSTRSTVPGRPVARFSNVLEAIGAVALIVWGALSFPLGHPILAVILLVLGVAVAWVTVREFRGHGLGKAPIGSAEDAKH